MVHRATHALVGTAGLLALILCPLLPSQRTWIVDANNGPGTNFIDLPAAFAAAGAGDTLLVRAGNYSSASTSTPLKLLADPGVAVGSGTVALTISAIPAGSTFVLSGVKLRILGGELRLTNNRGTVVVDNLTGGYLSSHLVRIDNCAHVALNSVRTSVAATNSTLTVANCPIGPIQEGYAGIGGRGSRVFVSRSTIFGGPSAASPNPLAYGPGHAIFMDGGELFLGPACRLQAGVRIGVNTKTASALFLGNGAVAHLDPNATLYGTFAPPVSVYNAPAPRVVTVASLAVTNALPGATVVIDIRSQARVPVVLAASLPTPPVASPLGWLALDPGTLSVFAAGTTDGQGAWRVAVPVPALSALRGKALGVQGLVALGSAAVMTTPGLGTVR